MLPEYTHKLLLDALEGMPDVLDALLRGIPANSAVWDNRPDPERFTLREVVAHLAEVEPLWRERALRTRDEDEPTLTRAPFVDDFPQSIPADCLAQIRAKRAAYVETLRSLPEVAWQRKAHSALLGLVTIGEQAVFVLTHDGYHTTQIAQWIIGAAVAPD